MNTYLGVDGGGSKTEFVLIDATGAVLATHRAGSAYYPEIGLDGLQELLAHGVSATLAAGGLAPADLSHAFFGLPAHGEDSLLLPRLNTIASPLLAACQYHCGNDVVCGWAGALACQDGINIVAGTGSIAYGEYAGRSARAGGWGELFSDEGSAYWFARAGLNLFSRMSDGRAARGPLYDIVRSHFSVAADLDVCAAIYGGEQGLRSRFAQLARLVTEAAEAGDALALALFAQGGSELAAIVDATRRQLAVPADAAIAVSYSGGMFAPSGLLLQPMKRALLAGPLPYALVEPRLPSGVGAALYAARCHAAPLAPAAIARLAAGWQVPPSGSAAVEDV